MKSISIKTSITILLSLIFNAILLQAVDCTTEKLEVKKTKKYRNANHSAKMPLRHFLRRAGEQRPIDYENICPSERGNTHCRGVPVCREMNGEIQTLCLPHAKDVEAGDECGACPSDDQQPHCSIEIDMECTVVLNDGNTIACDNYQMPLPTFEVCSEPPTSSLMLYNGGDCSQSDFFPSTICEDMNGGPPTEEGATSYIVVTSTGSENGGFTYFAGFVKVGDNFHLDGGGKEYQGDLVISIHSSSDIDNPATLLQRVHFHNRCESPYEMLSRYGASQIVEMTNASQGKMSAFAAVDDTRPVSITMSLSSQDVVVLTSLKVLTNFKGLVDLSAQINGSEIVPRQSVVTVLDDISINFAEQTRYSFLISVSGGVIGDIECDGNDFITFKTGQ